MSTDQAHSELTGEQLAVAIRAATEDVLATMLSLEAAAGNAFVEKEEATPASGVISILGIAGSWVGSGSLSCSSIGAIKLASRLLGDEYDWVTEEVLDAFAELTNMIIGNVKTKLEETLGPMGLSTPTVIYGREFQTWGPRRQKWTVVPFRVAGERFCVQLCIVPNPDQAARTGSTFAALIPHVQPRG